MSSLLSKTHTAKLYGLASLFLVFHHCFIDTNKMPYHSLFGDAGDQMLNSISWTLRICVTIYSFISGYGIAKKYQNMKNISGGGYILNSFSILFKFYLRYWTVYFILIPIGIIFFNLPFDTSTFLKGMFLGKAYCAEWWYVIKYIEFLILLPFLQISFDYVDKKIKNKNFPIYILCVLLTTGILVEFYINLDILKQRQYELTFVCSYIIGRYNLYERLYQHNHLNNKLLYIVGFIGTLICRGAIVSQSSPGGYYDCIFVVILVYCFGCLCNQMSSRIGAVLSFFGKYSIYIWLVHAFFIYYYLRPLTNFTDVPIFIFGLTIVYSLMFSIVFGMLERWINRLLNKFHK